LNIVVIGSGYVGTTAAAIFSVSGHHVTAIDIDPAKVEILNKGKAPFFEEGLDNLLSHGIKSGSLVATDSYEEAVKNADIIFSCVGTPDNPDGSSNLTYIFAAAEEAAKYMKSDAIFVQKSTVPVGTGREVTARLPESVSYVSNPEFLRESTSVYDTIFFDRVVAGGDIEGANQAVLDLHKTVEEHSADIAKISGIEVDFDKLSQHTGEYVSTHLESAELIKVTSNAFLALKISFANSIAQLADVTNADIKEVMSVVGSDNRIGKAFFNAGRGYGGGCFPKDVSGLITSAASFGVDLPIMTAASSVNSGMPAYVVDRMKKRLTGDLKGTTVAVLGLAFKAGTSDARKSPAVNLANILAQEGAEVTAYDPQASEEAKPDLNEAVVVVNSIKAAVANAKVVLIATDWKEFKNIKSWINQAPQIELLVDSMNCVSPDDVTAINVPYMGIGKAV